jgi:hypothetical protein
VQKEVHHRQPLGTGHNLVAQKGIEPIVVLTLVID